LLTLLFKKNFFAVALVVTLSGCGFQPMLKSDLTGKQSFVLTVKGNGYATYTFRREMEKQLALIPCLSNETYRIDVSLAGAQAAAAVNPDATIGRLSSTYNASYRISTKNGKSIAKLNTITSSYPVVPRDEFVTKNADLAATVRLMLSLAREVALEIVSEIKHDHEKNQNLKAH